MYNPNVNISKEKLNDSYNSQDSTIVEDELHETFSTGKIIFIYLFLLTIGFIL